MMESCIYEGWVRHRRPPPVEHAFRFPLFMMYLDLDELPYVFRRRWLWSERRPALARFRRDDHLGDPALPLDVCVRDLVEERTGRRPHGPVRLLTHLRYVGHVFNPLSLFYCFADDGRRLEAVVAEVTNIPWKERHAYVMAAEAPGGKGLQRFRTPKELHVSPFMDMELAYHWFVRAPERRLNVHIESRRTDGELSFDATLMMQRVEIDGRSLARALLRYPVMTAQVVGAIYWQAYRLRRKNAPWFPHPDERRDRAGCVETAS